MGGGFNALLGRYANRIGGASFPLDGDIIRLQANEGATTLHGGPAGFDSAVWTVESFADAPDPTLVLQHLSPDGDQGFPGDLGVRAIYRLNGDRLQLVLEATCSAPTVVNLSAHPYFNLAGADSGDVLGHLLEIDADAYLPTDSRLIPTGEIRAVAGTPFDFRRAKPIGAHIREPDDQLIHGAGYDHCFVLRGGAVSEARKVATLYEPNGGRGLQILTTQPGLQIYAGNRLDGSRIGAGGKLYRQSAGISLEPQGFPDAPNHPAFPSTRLNPSEKYRAILEFFFFTL